MKNAIRAIVLVLTCMLMITGCYQQGIPLPILEAILNDNQGTVETYDPESGTASIEGPIEIEEGVAEISVGVSPVEGENVSTSVSLPESVVAGSSRAKLTVRPYSAENVGSLGIKPTSSKCVISAIDISLELDYRVVKDFGDSVTVTTYILKGLESVSVMYEGETIDSNYNRLTGALTFTTTHFSVFYVESASVDAYVAETGIAYKLLNAFKNVKNGETIELLDNAEIQAFGGIDINNKSISVDLNNHTLMLSGGQNIYAPTIAGVIDVIGGASLEISNGEIKAYDHYNYPTYDAYAFAVKDSGKLILKDISSMESKSHDPFYVTGQGSEITIINSTIVNSAEGPVDSTDKKTFEVVDGAKLTLDTVTLTTSDSDAIFVDDSNSSVEISNCKINPTGIYILSTNAGEPDPGLTVTIKNSELVNMKTDGVGILFNSNGILNIEKSTIQADWQSLIARGCTASIADSKILSTGEAAVEGAQYKFYLLDEDCGSWDSGNRVPYAALVVGNGQNDVYVYPTTVNLNNTDVIMQRTAGVNDRATRVFIASANEDSETDCSVHLNIVPENTKYTDEINKYDWVWGNECYVNGVPLTDTHKSHRADEFKVSPLNDATIV